MRTMLRPRLMITCLIILPVLSMAQKQFSQSKIKAKTTVNVKTTGSENSESFSVQAQNQLIQKKINQRISLPQNEFVSSLLPASAASKIKQQIIEDASSTDKADVVVASPPPIKSFKGSKEGANLYPPDPGGAAGPDNVMHVNNKEYVFSDKAGSLLLTVPVDSFWSGFQGTATAIGYPHVEYDAQLKHFYIGTLATDLNTGDYAILFGASVSQDATAGWTLYELDLGPASIQDAPQIGYSKRWFTITTMQYDTASPNNFNSSGIFLMSLSNMIAGSLSNIYFVNDSNFFSMSPVETQDPNINNHYLISNLGSTKDTGFLYVVHIGGSLAAPTYNYDGYAKKATSWSTTPVYGSQNGTANQIYLGNTKLTGAVYRNAQIWTSHTVYLPAHSPKTAAVQWWEINALTRGVTQLGRVVNNPGTLKYAFPSLAVNKHKDVLLGYNQFSATTYPSAAYSYRNGTDAVNTMRKTKVYKQGKATYFDGGSSGITFYWGDYTATSVDPVDSSFWTVQEYAESPANHWGTWWAHVGDVSSPKSESAPVQAASADKISSISISPNPANNVAAINWSEEKSATVKIQISNNQGNILLTKEFSVQKGTNKISLNISNLISGVYSVAVFNGINIKKAQLIVE